MQALELGIPTQQSEVDLPLADDVRINDQGPVMRAAGNVVELCSMNFSFPPARPGGKPVFNFRSEGRSFAKSNRCLISASAFFEFTGKALSEERAPLHAARRAVHGDRRDPARDQGGRAISVRDAHD